VPPNTGGLDGLIEKFRQGGLEDVIKSWIGTGPNKPVAPHQLQQALGPDTVASLQRECGMPRDTLLSQLSRSSGRQTNTGGELPKDSDLLPGPREVGGRRLNSRL
jgi:uncharacterized protein YidB (DUF937 family)